MLSSVANEESFAVVAITQDEALIWEHGIGAEDIPSHIRPPIEVDHRHVRTGQNDHGHDAAHRYPEYFEAIAERLRGFSGILLIGHGHGKASYLELLSDYLERKHPDLNLKVLDRITLNLPAMSEGEIKSHARQWFEKNYRKLASWHGRLPSKWFT